MKNFLSVVLIPCLLGLAVVGNAQEFGLASYYSDDFQGRKTAYGDTYDKAKLTAAHKKHPYGTKLKVTRLDNNKSVEVMVNDKGPYIKGRIIDLSRAAAQKLDLTTDGVAQVKVEVVGQASATTASKTTPPKNIPKAAEERSIPKPNVAERGASSKTAERSTSSSSSEAKMPRMPKKEDDKKESKEKPRRLVGKDFQQYGLYKIVLERPEDKGYAVQVASLTNYQNVLRQVADLQAKWFDNILISVERGVGDEPIYKILLGPFSTDAAAQNYKNSLEKKHKIEGFTVNLDEIPY